MKFSFGRGILILLIFFPKVLISQDLRKESFPYQISEGSFTVQDPYLKEMVDSLSMRSFLFQQAIEQIIEGRLPVVLTTPERFKKDLGRSYLRLGKIATSFSIRDPLDPKIIECFVVVIDIDFLHKAYLSQGLSSYLNRDIQLMLAHEVYGHVAPSVSLRKWEGVCSDPEDVFSVPDRYGNFPLLPMGCAVERENKVRIQMGELPRMSYTLSGLTIGEERWGLVEKLFLFSQN